MIYRGFASVYDQLMSEAPYGQWRDYLQSCMDRYGNGGKRVLDTGCGTGEIAVLLKEAGFDVTGADLSEEMLSVAHQKAVEKGFSIPFYQMDMRDMSGFSPLFDGIFICCDSLNYLLTEDDVQAAFRQAFGNLEKNGLLIFDVHSPYKMSNIFAGATFADAGEEASYIWNCFEGEYPLSVEHELTFFIEEEDGRYERFDELHKQRTFTVQQYKEMLAIEGFSVIAVHADFLKESPLDRAERIFFIAGKKPIEK
ncbi:class I SAM-dependent DNA methyltransferase [Metabacillus sp. RGM 3146]|uniref:class I SAM-dependent DNA methyltransferase n=1 Tax=Metabacillus sp. RGM 3146 TaxID=3401092 RepID=UPI003B9A84DC